MVPGWGEREREREREREGGSERKREGVERGGASFSGCQERDSFRKPSGTLLVPH